MIDIIILLSDNHDRYLGKKKLINQTNLEVTQYSIKIVQSYPSPLRLHQLFI